MRPLFNGLRPATVITAPDLSITTIRNKISHFEASDDVFSKDFLTFVVLIGSYGGQKKLIRNTREVGQFLSTLGTTHVAIVDRGLAEQVGLVDGPYMASSHGFYPVRKLFPDRQGAFVASLVQLKTGKYATPSDF